MSPTTWTPTVPDEATVDFLDRYWGEILPEDVGPVLGQAAVLAAQASSGAAMDALVEQAMRFALADQAAAAPGAPLMHEASARRSPKFDVLDWLSDMHAGAAGRHPHRVTP